MLTAPSLFSPAIILTKKPDVSTQICGNYKVFRSIQKKSAAGAPLINKNQRRPVERGNHQHPAEPREPARFS